MMKNEDSLTSQVEEQTKNIPSITFLGAALAARAASGILMLLGKKQAAQFVGQWAPAILIIGTYNKLAKTFSPSDAPSAKSPAKFLTSKLSGSSSVGATSPLPTPPGITGRSSSF